jgi:hypothetical protein
MNKSIIFVLGMLMLSGFVSAGVCNDNSGSIWTTESNCGPKQNNNHYALGDSVWIRGEGFCNNLYSWDITGQPADASCDSNLVVANGNYQVSSNGTFCFEAYIVNSDDCGEYKATFNNKHDNYGVLGQIPEFGVVAGSLALLAGIGIVAFRRK